MKRSTRSTSKPLTQRGQKIAKKSQPSQSNSDNESNPSDDVELQNLLPVDLKMKKSSKKKIGFSDGGLYHWSLARDVLKICVIRTPTMNLNSLAIRSGSYTNFSMSPIRVKPMKVHVKHCL